MKIFTAPPETWEQIELTHETVYTYTAPVKFSPHRLVLRPREGHDIRLNTMNLRTYPESKISWYRDMLDNSIAVAEISEESSELKIVSEFTVSVPPKAEDGDAPIYVPHPSLVAGIEQMVAVPYFQFIYPPEVEHLRNWFSGTGLAPKPGQKAAIFDDMAILIHRVIKYRRREESGVQSPAETLRLASGSCRDMAVLMMETSRALGYPARFVSGYMESGNSQVGRGSTHAWAEIYLPAYGWTGYDPSVGRRVGPGHIAVGVSHHPRGVMPVAGGFTGITGVGTTLKVGISTKRLPPLQSPPGEGQVQGQSQ
ncbi:transglutaminase family protein [Luteolibacter sp. AS25]|uniref:transglutaminase family protein n=1 Tax=Luteolibacter sp. AS25 TaxID=3135776 RepID=UPI00398ADFC1